MPAACPPNASDHRENWVFGYGSLMWRPGFSYLEKHTGLVRGFHRSFCVYSYHHRGTRECPGMVLGLDRGGECQGIAYRIAATQWDAVAAYLRDREQVTSVYRDVSVDVEFADRPPVQALAFVVDRNHVQYAGRLPLEQQVEHIARGIGQSGRNPDYLFDMLRHLHQMGWEDDELVILAQRVAERMGAEEGAEDRPAR